jgi:hypothetical protein
MLDGYGKFFNRKTKTTDEKKYDRFFIYLPVEVARDSRFPFEEDEKLLIKIDVKNKRLIIEKPK